ncbi:NAD(P)-dependent oxidoreductase [Methanolobus sp.]|uniref:NAD-dependent epimerase/dehydratase family protein n=1 Tax=Methanolobus sp. TaxID=1874737 RepID=UPI0025CC4F9B|nr:NAD-dependent epimerase/dehydratase family protein [Methanolobus sp.]
MKYGDAIVTGDSGFIGSHLSKRLIQQDVDVLGVSRSTAGIDITKWEQVRKIPPKNVLFHLAGITSIPESFQNPRVVYENNISGILNMLEWCRINDVSKMIYSSTFVYGQPIYLPVDESHPVSPNNPYSSSKYLGEQLCESYCRDYGLDVVILRFFNIYGPGQKGNFLIPVILEQLSKGNVLLADSRPKRDYIYIDDVVDAFLCALNISSTGCNVFNIGSGKSFSVDEIANIIIDLFSDITGRQTEIKYMNSKRACEIADTVANIEKAEQFLNWCPATDIKKGLEKTLRVFLLEHSK